MDSGPAKSAAPRAPVRATSARARFGEFGSELRTDALTWSKGRSWLLRAPILLYLAYAGLRHVGDHLYSSFLFGGVTFGIHELGHLLFGWAGRFLATAGGSITQLAAPIATVVMFRRQRDYFAIVVGVAWLAFSIWNLATYLGDARAQELPLLGLSDDPQHDWHYMLGTLGLLSLDTTLAGLARIVAFGVWAVGVAGGVWLLLAMHRAALSGARR